MLEFINGKYKTISIVGMAKNSGKTVTLNHLIGEAGEQGVTIGITSIGRDGESLDIVTETEKPRIYVEAGTLIATSTGMIGLGDATIEILTVTEYRTPLGEIVIGRVKDEGYVEVAGPQLLSEIKNVSDIMLNLGAKFVIIDGALDRLSQAAPAISEATILATGAVLSRDINKVIEETIHTVNTLSLPVVEDMKVRNIIRKLMDNNEIAVIDENKKVTNIPLKTALNGGHIIGDYLRDNSRYLVIPGSLVKKTIEDLRRTTRRYKNIDIVIRDGTKIFINPKDWLVFLHAGVRVKVLDPVNLICITLNPYAPAGYYFEPREFLSKMKSYITKIPVMDLVLGGE
ncbi:hypothetical protein [Tissierella pigra]|uniref:Uncharacterized protein n=1 Tax=Tissierella pigra TaxID=2607614 RepID=A0A6N7XWF1_9FIRM|nr:hypothetical protein [Tissierella pigra]MSU00608.1 hypothetical protein [Tissierella pigra]